MRASLEFVGRERALVLRACETYTVKVRGGTIEKRQMVMRVIFGEMSALLIKMLEFQAATLAA